MEIILQGKRVFEQFPVQQELWVIINYKDSLNWLTPHKTFI